MTRDKQEFLVVDNSGDEALAVSSTRPKWSRKIESLERRGLARRIRPITVTKSGKQVILGAEWEIDREVVALRLTPRRKASEAQKAAAARARNARLRSESSAPAKIPDDSEVGARPPPPDPRDPGPRRRPARSSRLTRRREPLEES